MDDMLGDFLSSLDLTERMNHERRARQYVLEERRISESMCREQGVSWISYHHQAAVRFEVYTPTGNVCGARLRYVDPKGTAKYLVELGTPQFISHLHKLQVDCKYLIWCEGDFDRLAFLEAGFNNVLSCPGHALGAKDTPKYLLQRAVANAYANRQSIIATDNDAVGNELASHIERVVGGNPAVRLQFPSEVKDANSFLQRFGKEKLREFTLEVMAANPSEPFLRTDNVDLISRMKKLWDRGPAPGYSTGSAEIDQMFMWLPGTLVILTGYATSGKTTFLDWLLTKAYECHGWRTAFCSFEQPTDIHSLRLVGLTADLPVFHQQRPDFKVVEEALHTLHDRFAFLDYTETKEAPTLEHVMARLKEAIEKIGAKIAVIDPWNAIAPDNYLSEHAWITKALQELRQFARRQEIVLAIVAHPTKPQKGRPVDVPTGLDISGSAAWASKSDIGITVHRPKPQETGTEINCWKLRWDYLATRKPALRKLHLNYEPETGRYFPLRLDPIEDILGGGDDPFTL
jgi:hypothetical protein